MKNLIFIICLFPVIVNDYPKEKVDEFKFDIIDAKLLFWINQVMTLIFIGFNIFGNVLRDIMDIKS